MSEIDKIQLAKEKLMDLGISGDVAATLAENIMDAATPSVNSHAQGGKGGHAISLTYVDNYSTLMLVYVFLLNSLDSDQESKLLNKSLLVTLQKAMQEQQQYRNAFLEAVEKLNKL